MVFVQLSKIQRKEMSRHERVCRNQHLHDEAHPNLKVQRAAQEAELAQLVRAQAADKLRNVEVQVQRREVADAT